MRFGFTRLSSLSSRSSSMRMIVMNGNDLTLQCRVILGRGEISPGKLIIIPSQRFAPTEDFSSLVLSRIRKNQSNHAASECFAFPENCTQVKRRSHLLKSSCHLRFSLRLESIPSHIKKRFPLESVRRFEKLVPVFPNDFLTA